MPGSLERGVWQRDCDKCKLCMAFLSVPFFFGSIVFIRLFNLAGPAHYSVWCSLFYDGYAYLFINFRLFSFPFIEWQYISCSSLSLQGQHLGWSVLSGNGELNIMMKHYLCGRYLSFFFSFPNIFSFLSAHLFYSVSPDDTVSGPLPNRRVWYHQDMAMETRHLLALVAVWCAVLVLPLPTTTEE